ncbi:MAG: hypothetical protein JW828_07145 [Sedimentisphaerales bacterium]|nr:hypothetical protein [Sedimentisphaerales bacterium]
MMVVQRMAILFLISGIISLARSSSEMDRYNVLWTSPSKDASGSMPLGNGDIGLNVWMEETGDLYFYISKTDAWGDNARLLKIGKVRIRISPNPLQGDVSFQQELQLENGTIVFEINRGKPNAVKISVWVDAHDPVVYATAESAEPVRLTGHIELWRNEPNELPSLECSDVMQISHSRPKDPLPPTVVQPDTIFRDLQGRIGWVHHNSKSVGPAITMKVQGLDDFPMADPLLGRTFGAVITAENSERVNDMTLTTRSAASQRFSVFVLTEHPSTPEQWLNTVDGIIRQVEQTDFAVRRHRHEQWWGDFWQRSWIHIDSDRPPSPPAMVGQNDHPIRIGIDQSGGNRFVGQIGRVSVFTQALNPEQILLLTLNRTPLQKEGVIGSWVDVPIGKELADIDPNDLAGPLTWEAWIMPGALPASGGRIIDKVTPGKDDGILLDTWPGNSLRLISMSGHVEVKNCLTLGTWHHVAATLDPSTGTQRLFLDGKMIGEQSVNTTEPAFAVSQAYQLQRFINACAGRGRYPIKFNGSIFTVPAAGMPGDADFRRWGPGYWWQNTRLPYISMPASGDFDLMRPLFRMYVDDLMPLFVHRTKKYLGHDGAFIPECIYFWGAVFSETYGWTPYEQRQDKLQESGWHKWEWVSGPELVFMMFDYYDYTLDESFLKESLLPTAHQVLTFFDQHYKTGDDGKLVMHPSQALETWWDCTNPMPEVAGLHAVTGRLLVLPEKSVTAEQREFWKSFQDKLPPVPVREENGVRMLAPAEQYADKRNIENPELYAVFPFRLVSFEKDNAALGRAALEHRLDRGNSGWRQDDIFMAYLGLTEQAREYVAGRALNKDKNSRFPAFWGPNYDWVPDQDHGGILLRAVQSMLLQTEGKKVFLLPAWPKDWNVDFKLHAPYRTVIQGRYSKGRLERLDITPSERKEDVIVVNSILDKAQKDPN